MANPKPEPVAAKEENDADAQHEQPDNQQTGQQNFGGPKRGGHNNRFGNRRPGPYPQRGGGHGGDNFGRRRGGGAGPHGGPGPHGGHGGHGGPNHNDQGPMGPRGPIDKINDKLSNMGGPTFDLPPLEQSEKKFSGRTRLYVGNIGNEVDESELKELFSPYGETSEYFINKEKNFAFVRVDYRINAEKAKRELDGILFKGKNLKIRFAPNGSTIKVKNLTNFVSNELLYYAFSVFGEVERSYVVVDERGKPTGEGVVEFARKGCALHAVRKCSEGCFFLTSSLRPCIVESYEPSDDTDGYPEKYLPKKNPEYSKHREVGPRFAGVSSFEHEYGMRWKQLHELYAQKEQAMKKEYEMEKEKLEAQMEFARYEHETEMLRDQLRAREMDRDRQKHEWEMKERMAEEQRQRNEEQMRRQQEEMQNRIIHQEEELRRRQQENNLFMQAHQLDNMLEQQEQAYDQPAGMYNNMNQDGDAPVVRNNHRFEGRGDMGPTGPRNGGGGGRGHWVSNDNRRDDFPPKRRRY
ncbi:hrp65 protein-like isoform X2 [Zophobas morio]|uniref:hrp65 protein-like isoform X2 n=1 Tax=Zophobas morio TaxID=2755281 RepID=UPI0030837054